MDAAISFAPKLGKRQAEVRQALHQYGPATADEIAQRIGRHWYVTRPRLSELLALGEAVKTGERRRSAYGGQQTVYRPPTEEERALFTARKAAEAEKTGGDA
jgi:hypothetical protein